jgi:phage-related baseplate assembly protein
VLQCGYVQAAAPEGAERPLPEKTTTLEQPAASASSLASSPLSLRVPATPLLGVTADFEGSISASLHHHSVIATHTTNVAAERQLQTFRLVQDRMGRQIRHNGKTSESHR